MADDRQSGDIKNTLPETKTTNTNFRPNRRTRQTATLQFTERK